MILEPKDKPTIVRVTSAFLDLHAPNRFKAKYSPPVHLSKRNENEHKLRAYLTEPRTTVQMTEHLGVSFSYLKMLLSKINAKNIIKGRPKRPGTWKL